MPDKPSSHNHPEAGQLPRNADLVDIDAILRAYEQNKPDPKITAQRVQFGTSGHRGSATNSSFNQDHIWAITHAICLYRKKHGISGPLFLGFDTHALSLPAYRSALEVLAAHGITVKTAANDEFTPTPVISHAILTYNRDRSEGLSDGIVITPSHNPPSEGGFKYNPPHGGPAEKGITDWIQNLANDLLAEGLASVKKIPFAQAERATTTQAYDYITPYVNDLGAILDLNLLRDSKIKMGVDPMGGAGVHYWPRIAEHYKLDLHILNKGVDPTFRFMTRDWDGQIRMDPSSAYAMKSLIGKAKDFDIAFGCDTDHDRHGIVTKSSGLMPANHYLAASIHYLFTNRPGWAPGLGVGKTMVSSHMIDKVTALVKGSLYEVPVGFKWFVDGLLAGKLAFTGEESAGASFLRKDGTVWTTDKDGFIPALLSAEMTARLGKDPAELYRDLESKLGTFAYARTEAPANAEQRARIGKLTEKEVHPESLGGDPVNKILSKAPGNGQNLGGLKLETDNGWIAVRPSGTEDIYKIYAESYKSQVHLQSLLEEGQAIIDSTSA